MSEPPEFRRWREKMLCEAGHRPGRWPDGTLYQGGFDGGGRDVGYLSCLACGTVYTITYMQRVLGPPVQPCTGEKSCTE